MENDWFKPDSFYCSDLLSYIDDPDALDFIKSTRI